MNKIGSKDLCVTPHNAYSRVQAAIDFGKDKNVIYASDEFKDFATTEWFDELGKMKDDEVYDIFTINMATIKSDYPPEERMNVVHEIASCMGILNELILECYRRKLVRNLLIALNKVGYSHMCFNEPAKRNAIKNGNGLIIGTTEFIYHFTLANIENNGRMKNIAGDYHNQLSKWYIDHPEHDAFVNIKDETCDQLRWMTCMPCSDRYSKVAELADAQQGWIIGDTVFTEFVMNTFDITKFANVQSSNEEFVNRSKELMEEYVSRMNSGS